MFDHIAAGRLNALAAVLRGELVPEGDLALLMAFQRFFPTASFSSEAPNWRTREEPAMSGDLVRILEGNTFVVSDDRGDIEATLTDPTGLFSFDTRFLSRWCHRQRRPPERAVDGRPPLLRGAVLPRARDRDRLHRLEAPHPPACGRLRLHRGAAILNHDEKAVALEVRLEAGSDFADLFEVKDAQEEGDVHEPGRAESWSSGTAATPSSGAPSRRPNARRWTDPAWTFCCAHPAHGEWKTDLRVTPTFGGLEKVAARRRGAARDERARWRVAGEVGREGPVVEGDVVRRTYDRSLVDMAALRFAPLTLSGQALPAAGLPWFMTMFGRDSIFTSLQALPFSPELAPRRSGRSVRASGPGWTETRTPVASSTRCASGR